MYMQTSRVCGLCEVRARGAVGYCSHCHVGAEAPEVFEEALSKAVKRGLPVKAEFSPLIYAQLPTITGNISKVEIIWKGLVVTEVPSGELFDVKMYYTAYNPGGGRWEIAGTVSDIDGTLRNYEIAQTSILGGNSLGGQVTLNKYGSMVMPSNPVTLRVKLWGHPYIPSTPPDSSLWWPN